VGEQVGAGLALYGEIVPTLAITTLLRITNVALVAELAVEAVVAWSNHWEEVVVLPTYCLPRKVL
jgi:hypothetical protein